MPFPRRIHRRCVAAALGLSLIALPMPALAGPAEGDTADSLYNAGGLYETADYEGAIGMWTKAYAKLEWSPGNAEIKVGLLYNLAGAHEEAFGINGKLSHLNKAVVLLERFEENIPKIYGEGPEADAERGRAEERMRRIEGKIDEPENSGGPTGELDREFAEAEREAEPTTEQPEPEPTPEPTPRPRVEKVLTCEPPGNSPNFGGCGAPEDCQSGSTGVEGQCRPYCDTLTQNCMGPGICEPLIDMPAPPPELGLGNVGTCSRA